MPVFIVGVPYSGADHLACLLSLHNRMACGPPTGFFKAYHETDSTAFASPEAAVEFARPFAKICGVSLSALLRYYRRKGHTPTVVLESLAGVEARKQGKTRWVEMSPTHMCYVTDIRLRYPYSPIIRVVRDPRDVCASWQRAEGGNLEDYAKTWLIWNSKVMDFFAKRASHTLHYEHLIAHPEGALRDVCTWVNEDFDAAMLQPVQPPPEPFGEWRHVLTWQQQHLIEQICGELSKPWGYEFYRSGFCWKPPKSQDDETCNDQTSSLLE